MQIIGHGVDIVSVDRIDQMLRDHGQRFMDRCFTPDEQTYCNSLKRRAEHFAVRFAAKEAVLKTMGKGLTDGIEWTDIEVRRHASGKPSMLLTGRAATIASELGIDQFLVSLSHTDTHAIASVIAVGT